MKLKKTYFYSKKLKPKHLWISSICETNGINIHYLRTGGNKPPVVLLHGLMCSNQDREFEDLPIVILNSWNEVSKAFVLKKLKEFFKSQFKFEKLLSDYWIKQIMEVRNKYIPCAKKTYFTAFCQNDYLGFKLQPIEVEVVPVFSEEIKQWSSGKSTK